MCGAATSVGCRPQLLPCGRPLPRVHRQTSCLSSDRQASHLENSPLQFNNRLKEKCIWLNKTRETPCCENRGEAGSPEAILVLLSKATCGGRCPYKINPTVACVTVAAPCSTHRLSLATPLACWCLPPDSKLGGYLFHGRPLFPRAWSCRDSGGKRTQVIRLGARTRVPLNPVGCCPALAARWYPCASQYSSVGLPGTPGETGRLRRQVSQEQLPPNQFSHPPLL